MCNFVYGNNLTPSYDENTQILELVPPSDGAARLLVRRAAAAAPPSSPAAL